MKTQSCHPRALLAGAALLALAAVPAAHADYQSTVLSQGPLGYWRLNETVQPQPASGAANLGTLGATVVGTYNNFPTRGLTGPFSGSLAVGFDGTSQSVTTPWLGDLNTTNAFSVEIWANPGQVPKFAYLASSVHLGSPRSGWYLAQDDGSVFSHGSAFVLRMFYQNGSTPAITLWAPVSVANSWYHLVITYDGTTASLYTNGVVCQSGTPAGYVGNVDAPFSVGCRSDNGYFWPGEVAEVALYKTALSSARVSSHYSTATTTPASYATTVQADSPALYYRFREAIDPPAANLGTLGSAAGGLYMYNATAGVVGPSSPPYTGFEAANKAVGFDGGGGVVRIPALNMNTNTVTISGWIKANGLQNLGTGLIVCHSGTSWGGLITDPSGPSLGLGYVWNGNNYGWSPSGDPWFFPTLPDGDWAYVALVIQPTEADIYLCDRTNYANFKSITNTFNVKHMNEAFDGVTLFGKDSGFANRNFNGTIDEVAIFNRALGAGEVYTEYASAVGAVPPKIFADLQAPSTVFAGDPLVLTVDAGGTPPLSFTWHKGGTTVATTTNGVFSVASASLLDSGTYDVTISNGSGSAPSQQVTVVVSPPTAPSITDAQGFRRTTLYNGGTLRLSVVATGGGLKYQWYKNSTAIASATTSAFSILTVTNTDAGSYSVSVTNALGTASNAPAVIAIPSYTSASYEGIVIAAKPEAWWRLDEVGGTNLWDGMGRHDGVYTSLISSDPPVTFGAVGAINNDSDTAITFTPSKEGVGVVPYSPAINPNVYTVEAWVKTTVTSANIVPLSTSYTGDMGWLWQTVGGFWNGNGANIQDYGATTAGITPGIWTHLVLTYDRSRGNGGFPYQYFINGKGDAGYIWSGPSLNNAGPLIIGAHGVSATLLADSFFDGQVDEVAIYPRILSGTEIQAHFQGRFGASTPPYFVTPLTSLMVPTDKPVTFTTQVQGSVPMGLQWSRNGSPIAGATTTTLSISSVGVTDAGTYTLTATNAAGTNSVSATLTVVPPVGFANVTNGLVMHLRFDGNLTDATGRGNNGTAVGAPTYVQGIVGAQALQYTTLAVSNYIPTTNITVGSANYVDLGTTADLKFDASASFTVGLWVRVPTNYNGGDLPFIGNETGANNNPGWDISPTYGGGGWQFCLNDGVTAGLAVTNNIDVNDANAVLSDGGWHYLALVVDRSAHVATMYADGVLAASRDITALGSIDTGARMTIGQDPTGQYPSIATPGSTDFDVWSGTQKAILDDLGVWRRALTQLEVINIYSAGSTGGRSFDTVAPPITITVTKTSSGVTLSWAGGTLLESATLGPNAVWSPVPGAYGPTFTVTPGAGNKFYRVLAQ